MSTDLKLPNEAVHRRALKRRSFVNVDKEQDDVRIFGHQQCIYRNAVMALMRRFIDLGRFGMKMHLSMLWASLRKVCVQLTCMD